MAKSHLMLGANNLPQITNATHSHTVYDGTTFGGDFTPGGTAAGLGQAGNVGTFIGTTSGAGNYQRDDDHFGLMVRTSLAQRQQLQPENKPMAAAATGRRLVKVIIVDPDDKVPLTDCVLYSGSEELTDLTDQELFFEIDIKTLLDAHNAKRVKIMNKTIKERTEYLETVKVRDLRMVVVTVASF